ncbi:MAG TPA: type II toxin-antitoxin system VapC family toxin [Mycobacteriales bacterium]|nr:type II toxin-antitoxin system VapC family toxin [Mycobacteriales bacterium]
MTSPEGVAVFVDTNVFVYAAADSPYRVGSARVVEALAAGALSATTSTAVIEELWHLELSRRVPGLGGIAEAAFTLMRPVLAVTDEIVAAAFQLDTPDLGANDRVHVATCAVHGIPAVLTADRGFDAAAGIRRIDPADLSAVQALLEDAQV